MSRVHFIVNPRASNGRCGRVWRRVIAPALAEKQQSHEVLSTERGGHAIELAEACVGHADVVVSVGGDGTHNEVATGLLRAGDRAPWPKLGCLTLGTGGDFRRTLGLPRAPLEQLDHMLSGLDRPKKGDLGKLTYLDHDGQERVRAFINIASFGLSGEVDERVNRTTKAFGGFASFLIGTLRAAVGYKNRPVSLSIDGGPTQTYRIYTVAVANGQYFGGGMRVAPAADPCDGLFDVVVMGDLRFGESLRAGPAIYQGAHVDFDKVEVVRARTVTATSDVRVLLDVDGEQLGCLPASFEMLPECLDVLGMAEGRSVP